MFRLAVQAHAPFLSICDARRTAYLDAEVRGMHPAVCCAGCCFMLCMAGSTLQLLLCAGLICVR